MLDRGDLSIEGSSRCTFTIGQARDTDSLGGKCLEYWSPARYILREHIRVIRVRGRLDRLTRRTDFDQLGVEHLVARSRPHPRQVLGNQGLNFVRRHLRLPVDKFGVLLELLTEELLVSADSFECLVKINSSGSGKAFLAPDIQANQVAVSGPKAEPPAHLHKRVSLPGSAAIISDGKALDGKAPG